MLLSARMNRSRNCRHASGNKIDRFQVLWKNKKCSFKIFFRGSLFRFRFLQVLECNLGLSNLFWENAFRYELTRGVTLGTINRFSPRGISPITALLELVKETAADLGRLEGLGTRRLRVCYHHSSRCDRKLFLDAQISYRLMDEDWSPAESSAFCSTDAVFHPNWEKLRGWLERLNKREF